MRAQHLAQRRMQQVRAGVVALRRVAELCVDDRVHPHSQRDGLLHLHAMRAHTLHRLGAAQHIADYRVVIVRAQPAVVADLAARVGIERRVVEHDLHLFTCRSRRDTHTIAHNGEHLAVG